MKDKTDIGVVVGRFQVHDLHAGHREFLDMMADKYRSVLVLLGVSPVLNTVRNPLDYPTREAMIKQAYPGLICAPIADCKEDSTWSALVDMAVRTIYPTGSITLHGGRDSFISHYKGSFKTEEFEPSVYVSGTNIRKAISHDVLVSPEFRAGVIYASFHRFPAVFPTVDVAILRKGSKGEVEILLGMKPGETKWRFPGGFLDKKDLNFEAGARREAKEETGDLNLGVMHWIGTYSVNDWRYKNERDCIKTTFFWAQYVSGPIFPNDDLEKVKWFVLEEANSGIIIDTHKDLMDALIHHLEHEPTWKVTKPNHDRPLLHEVPSCSS